MRSPGTRDRSAFTLIELLVVIGIIAILAGLLIVAVPRLLDKGPDLQDLAEIKQLQVSVDNFKAKFGVYPPSKIVLYPSLKYYYNSPNPLVQDSLYYILKVWPRLNTKKPALPLDNNSFFWDPVNPTAPPWNNNNYQWVPGVLTPPTGYVLEGDQCLVFFLGGPGGTQGFSFDPLDPCKPFNSAANPPEKRLSFFQFQSKRLRDPINTVRNGPTLVPSGFPSYLNNWARTQDPLPFGYYAYFSSGKRKNGYNSNGAVTHEIAALDNVAPYYDAFTGPDAKGNYNITNYLNPSSFQIISAGKDGFFTNYNPIPNPNDFAPLAAFPYPISSPILPPQRCHWNNGISNESTNYWRDNRANFTPNQLQVQ